MIVAATQSTTRQKGGHHRGTYPALRRATRSGETRDDNARFAGGLDLVLDAIAGRTSR
jgi:hypothetical protein